MPVIHFASFGVCTFNAIWCLNMGWYLGGLVCVVIACRNLTFMIKAFQ